ncbi:hypothetical protein T439DRAFT_189369 [Meredithblackwellia eburnea MCA 4105]
MTCLFHFFCHSISQLILRKPVSENTESESQSPRSPFSGQPARHLYPRSSVEVAPNQPTTHPHRPRFYFYFFFFSFSTRLSLLLHPPNHQKHQTRFKSPLFQSAHTYIIKEAVARALLSTYNHQPGTPGARHNCRHFTSLLLDNNSLFNTNQHLT